MGKKRNAYRLLMGKPGGKRSLGRPRHRYLNNIELDPREIEWGGIEWISVVQYRNCEYGNEPSGFIKCWEVL
jgi:hypothetical protein